MTFFVGYDKSFWINTVMGGKEITDIEAKCSGINLKKGGVYILEFEYNSGREGEIPIMLRAGDKVYFKDSIKTKSDKVKYSKEITIDENVENSEIVYQLGTLDSFQFTLTNIKLTYK